MNLAEDEYGDEPSIDEVIDWNAVAVEIHEINVSKGFWPVVKTDRNVGEMLMLTVSEFAEALDAEASGLNDDKLVNYPGVFVEIADAAIRLADGCAAFDADISNGALSTHSIGLMNLGDYTSLEADFTLIIRYLSAALELHRKGQAEWTNYLAHCFGLTIQLFGKYNIPFECIFEKMEYNSKRPFKHGKAY
jgi:hypothetical protein